MIRSLFTGIGGLRNHQIRMDVVANNIANVNTIGFKKGRANFQDILSQTLSGASLPTATGVGGTNPRQVGLGMTLGAIDNLFNQGNLQTTGVNTDMAIQGNGMFILSDGQQRCYTRAGAFSLDSVGGLVDSATGWHVLGWQGVGGVITPTPGTESNITIPVGTNIAANPTSAINFGGNLDANTAVGGTYTGSVNFYDSLGAAHTLITTYTKTAANTWSVRASSTDPTVATINGVLPVGWPVLLANNLVFNGAGTLVPTPVTENVAFTFTNGAAPIVGANILNYAAANVTQYAADNSLVASSQDGYSSGALLSFTVSDTGIISGTYSNGIRRDLAQVALAHFINYGGLQKEGNNMFSESSNSGLPQVGTASTGGRGTLAAGTLEMSNVDLSEEFTTMITAERGFQANSRSITTSDEMLQELLQLKR